MAIDPTSVTAETVQIRDPLGALHSPLLASYDQGTQRVNWALSRTFTHVDNGSWQPISGTVQKVLDDSGNPVAGGVDLGPPSVVSVPVPADTTPPVMTHVSTTPLSITAAGFQTITVTADLSDA